MYKFLYYYFYLAYKKKNHDYDAKWWGAIIAFISFLFHMLIIVAFIEILFNVKLIQYPAWLDLMPYGKRKWILTSFMAIIGILFGISLIKRHEQIEKEYEGKEMLTLKNLFLVLLTSVGPIILIFILSKIKNG